MQTITIALDHLCEAVDAARETCTDSRWRNAIETAYDWLLEQDTLTYDDHGALIVDSLSNPGQQHRANGVCDCQAFAAGKACWHRAARQLVVRALERQNEANRQRIRLTYERALAEVNELFD